MKPSATAHDAARAFLASSLLSLVLLRSSSAQQSANQQALTTDAVVQMLSGGQSVDQVVAKIRSTPGSYPMTPSDDDWLTKNGVPVRVIIAMRRRNEQNARDATNGSEGLAHSTSSKTTALPEPELTPKMSALTPLRKAQILPHDWKAVQTKNKLTDQVSNSLVIRVPGDPMGTFVVSASCNRINVPVFGDMNSVDLTFQPVESNLHYVLSDYTLNGKAEQTLSGNYEVTPAVHQSCVRLGLRFGASTLTYQKSQVCGDDRVADVLFREDASVLSKKMKTAMGMNTQNPLASLLGGLMDKAVPSTILQLPSLLSADSFRVELPLSNGQHPVITLPVGDTLQKFANACIPPLPPPPPIAPEVAAVKPPDWKPSDGFIFGMGETVADRRFEGTLEEFAAAMPGFVKRALAGSGLSRNYDQEIALGVQHVRFCPGMTSQTQLDLQRSSVPTNRALYRSCSNPSMTMAMGPYDFHSIRGLDVVAGYASPAGSNWTTISVSVRFSRLVGDYNENDDRDARIEIPGYMVMQATLHR